MTTNQILLAWACVGTLAAGAACGSGGLPDGFSNAPPSGQPANATCGTGSWWSGGNRESANMRPGGDCISCHSSGEGPRFQIAGTVMAEYDDANDCQGVDGVTVTLKDPNGAVIVSMDSNAAGNFYSNTRVPADRLPYTVELKSGSRTSVMATAQMDTNCMTCHTTTGAGGAPGRIRVP